MRSIRTWGWAPLIGVALLFAGRRAIVIMAARVLPFDLPFQTVNWYNYATQLTDYFSDGIIRRGIPGTLFHLLRGLDPGLRISVFHLLCAAWLLIPLGIVLRRLSRTAGSAWIWISLVLVLSPQLFLAWGRDMGRADMLSAGFVVWAMLACLDARFLLAAVAIFLGSQVHEIALIYGGPLALAVGFLHYREGRAKRSDAVAALGLLGALLAAMTVGGELFGHPPHAVAASMLAQAPPHPLVEMAVYMTVGGFRTIVSSNCMALGHPQYPLYLATVFLLLPLYGLILPASSRLRLGLMLFVSLLPLTFISLVAIDYGRWLSFAVLNWWLMNVALQVMGVEAFGIDWRPAKASILAGAVVLAMGQGDIRAANAGTVRLAWRLWGEYATPQLVASLDRCDPNWRSVLQAPDAPVRR